MKKQLGHGYEWAAQVKWDSVPGCILEIGSERGGGSTAFLAALAQQHDRNFYSVDFEQAAHWRAKETLGCRAVLAKGEDFLARFTDDVAFAYLDNYDWLYQAFPKTSAARQSAVYAEYGMELNNTNSANTHAAQAELVEPLVMEGGMVSVDDTWMSEDFHVWLGKGMLVTPWLLDCGWKLLSEPVVAKEITSGYVVLQRRDER